MRRAPFLLGFFVLAACPGRLTSPERFTDATLAFSCDPSIDVQKDLVIPRCATSGCHSADGPANDLDLQTPGVALRIYGKHAFGCAKELLLDPDNPFGGYFFDKLTLQKPACGVPMPETGARLTPAELACVHLWLAKELQQAAAAQP
jgi:hypothetical protein